MTREQKLAGCTAVITGASRGLGYALSLALAREGAHVIAVARTQGGLEELDDAIKKQGGSATLVPADLTDFASIDRLGAAIFERWKKLDILVGNAGFLGKLTPVSHMDQSMIDKVFAVNFMVNYRLIRSLDPLLRQATAGRAVFITSGVAEKCTPFWGAYSTSKAALNTLVKTYAGEVVSSNITANLFSPGPVRTAMRAQAMPGENPETLPSPDTVAQQIVPLCLSQHKETGKIYRYNPQSIYPVCTE